MRLQTLFVALILFGAISAPVWAEFRAGASAVDISPRVLPAIRNGGFLERKTDRVSDPLHARCLVLADDNVTIALAVVDSCMAPREVCDQIKAIVERETGIPASRQLIAATHTHTAPSLMRCLGAREDPAYIEYFIPRVAEAIVAAYKQLQPAEIGWSSIDAPNHTHCRRWLCHPDFYQLDPFGKRTVRAMMHPGYQNSKYLGPAGPVDSQLGVLSVRTLDGRPICVLANYSMHYFGGGGGFSADYYGDFARYLESKLGGDRKQQPQFVAIMSQGTSGDQHWMDYSQPQREDYRREQYAQEVGDLALSALETVTYRRDVDLDMAQRELTLRRRLPSPERISWAQEVKSRQQTEVPADRTEVYAHEALWLHDNPTADLVLQAVRIGDLGLTAIPNEVYGITGLKLKAQAPFGQLMNLELANGAEGYIPPPEQHYLGGYTTWPARTAGLEVEAEPRIVETLLDLLEEVSGKQRKPLSTDFYNDQQRAALEAARKGDNNRVNRGVDTHNR